MKSSGISIALLLGVVYAQAQTTTGTTQQGSAVPTDTAYAVVERGANHRIWERTTCEHGPNGMTVPKVHRYTELASGLNYKDANGNWQESKELIESYPGGAIARQGQYQVIFANDLNSYGAIDMQTPDGKRLRSNILGLMYVDTSTGDAVMIAHLQDSTGQLISANQVLYPNAFDGVKADVRYTYRKGGFEQDVILRKQPPTPDSLGLNPDTTELEVFTEFIDPPATSVKDTTVKSDELETDQSISWGAVNLGQGKAFYLGDQASKAPIVKRYVTIQGRHFLLEKVRMKDIQQAVTKLPQQAAIDKKLPVMAMKKLSLPTVPLVRGDTHPMRLATTTLPDNGYVLDYVTLNTTYSNFTFQADTTYYISGDVYLYGNTTFEGGTVVKYHSSYSAIISGSIICKTGPCRMACFTSMDDDSSGETISGSSGTPTMDTTWNNGYLRILSDGIQNLQYLRFAYAYFAVDAASEKISNCQFLQCNRPIYVPDATLYNDLFTGCTYAIYPLYNGTVWGENLTVDGDFIDCSLATMTLNLTNCLITGSFGGIGTFNVSHSVLSYYSGISGFTRVLPPYFQKIGAGNYYLTNSSLCHNAGTTDIDPVLLAELRQKTTYPPMVYSNITITTNLVLDPQVPRDTNAAPDLGYHYDPLDYAFCGVSVVSNATLTVNPGTVIACFSDGSVNGLTFDNGQYVSQGSPTRRNRVVDFNAVQEQSSASWSHASDLIDIYNASPISCRFTDFVETRPSDDNLWNLASHVPTSYQDCEFYGGQIFTEYATVNLTNCLFFRLSSIQLNAEDGNPEYILNNLFIGGTFNANMEYGGLLQNNLFDRVGELYAYDWYGLSGWTGLNVWNGYGSIVGGHNAFVSEYYPLSDNPYYSYPYLIEDGPDVYLANPPAYQTGPLGDFYLPSDSPLIDQGSTNANVLGFYYFTTQTNQIKETNSIVDIGYHYVAVDEEGNPLETLTNNMPDYLVDANGDGLPDWWQMLYFGDLNQTANTLDGSGNTMLSDYQSGDDPTTINFSIQVSNNYVHDSQPSLKLSVTGVPYYQAVLVDNTNLSEAAWTNYSGSNLTVNLGSTEGWHQIWVGLKAFYTNSSALWVGKRLKLDQTPPGIVITAPNTGIVSQPIIELQGYCSEPLGAISYDITNGTGLLTNQQILVLNQFYDTNVLDFTTNTFQGFDIAVTNGLNTITVHAADLAGNVTTTNFNYTLDYTDRTNPPTVELYWPQDGAQINGDSFTWRGWVSDFTASIIAQLVDTNGNTNIFNAIVERDGHFWVENLPLNPGTNAITLVVTDAAGNVATTNCAVVQGDIGLTISPPDSSQFWNPTMTVYGSISSGDYAVWVNGVKATINGNSWEADEVPNTPGGTALLQARAIPDSDNGGNGSGGSGGAAASYDNPSNPESSQAQDAESQINKPPRLYMESYSLDAFANIDNELGENYDGAGNLVGYALLTDHIEQSAFWSDQKGGNGETLEDYTGDYVPGIPVYNDSYNGFAHQTYGWASTAWPTITVDSTQTEYFYQDEVTGETNSYTNSDGVPPGIYMERGTAQGQLDANGDYSNGIYCWAVQREKLSVNYTGMAVMKLQTGGKSSVQRQNLFCLSATAQGAGVRFYPYWTGVPPFSFPDEPYVNIDSADIAINGKSLGSDGNLWITLPDNANIDVTPIVKNCDYYTFNEPTPQKYKLTVRADVPLAPDKINETNCVGQNINFTLDWEPGRPPIVSSNNVQWTLDGSFVNKTNQQLYPDASIDYTNDPALLKFETTHGWWYDGKYDPVTLTASFSEDVTFDNGQTVTVAASGLFAMHRPKYKKTNALNITEFLTHRHEVGEQPSAHLDSLQVYNGKFWLEIDSHFGGESFITQTFTGSIGNDDGPFDTHGNNYLDNNIIAGAVNVPPLLNRDINVIPDVSTNILAFDDGPQESCSGHTWHHSQFLSYVQFKPAGGIPVTIGIVKWHNDGDTYLVKANPPDPTPLDYTPLLSGSDPQNTDGSYRVSTGDAKYDDFTTDNDFPNWIHIYTNGDHN